MVGLYSNIFTIDTYIKYATIPSTVILIVLTALQRRYRPNNCGYRFPALVVPMRFLDGYSDRLAYALSFGSITSIIVAVLFNLVHDPASSNSGSSGGRLFCDTNSSSICHQTWARTLILQGNALVISLVCVPHFICISTSYKLAGALMGFAYSIYWIVFYSVGAAKSEKYNDRTVGTLMLLRDLPVILCSIGLCIRSVYAIYRCYMIKSIRVQVVDNVVEKHQADHVVNLLREPPEHMPLPEGFWPKLKEKVKSQILPNFKLPTRVVCLAFMQMIIVYYLGSLLTIIGVVTRRESKKILFLYLYNSSDINPSTLLDLFDVVYALSVAVGALSSVIYIILFIINYRINMVNIYKGDKRLYLSKQRQTARVVAESLRLPGYQVAYIIWGYLFMFLAIFCVLAIVIFGIYILHCFDLLKSTAMSFLETLSVPASAIIIFYLQVLLVQMFLLQPKIHEEDESPPLNVNNRNVYELAAYTLVFSNMLVGFASALFRTMKSFILGLIFLGRLDRCLLMPGFENLDPGYMAYVGSLLVDNAQNNPTMRTFCAILIRLSCRASDKGSFGIDHLLEPKKTCSNSKAARRWHLAYTLLKNPDLLPRRKLALLLMNQDKVNDDNNRTPVEMKPVNFARLPSTEVSHEHEQVEHSTPVWNVRDNCAYSEAEITSACTDVEGGRMKDAEGYRSMQPAFASLDLGTKESLEDVGLDFRPKRKAFF